MLVIVAQDMVKDESQNDMHSGKASETMSREAAAGWVLDPWFCRGVGDSGGLRDRPPPLRPALGNRPKKPWNKLLDAYLCYSSINERCTQLKVLLY